MEKNILFHSWIVLVLIVIVLVISLFLIPRSGDSIKSIGNIKQIDIQDITDGEAYIDNIGQQYKKGDIETVFTYAGLYKGIPFRRTYTENNEIKMQITTDLNPTNGIIEGYVIEKIEDEPYVYIYLDEDWKQQLPNTNIFWGKDYQFEKIFVFNEISDGVYMEKIKDDVNRFSDNYKVHRGGIIVGDITRDNEEDATLIRLT